MCEAVELEMSIRTDNQRHEHIQISCAVTSLSLHTVIILLVYQVNIS